MSLSIRQRSVTAIRETVPLLLRISADAEHKRANPRRWSGHGRSSLQPWPVCPTETPTPTAALTAALTAAPSPPTDRRGSGGCPITRLAAQKADTKPSVRESSERSLDSRPTERQRRTRPAARGGLSDDVIAHRIAIGHLFREYAGMYSVGRPATTPLERASAAVLACGSKAALSHASAMVLWGFWRRWETPFEVTVIRGHPRPPGVTVHRSRTLTSRDVRTQLGIRVTSPARTLLDIAPRLTPQHLARTVDDALHTDFLTRGALTAQIGNHPHAPGASRIAALLSTTDGPSRSDWERSFPAFCRRHGLPRPRLNTTVAGYEVDALFPRERLIVELDGWDFHRSRTAFESDRNRDADTLRAGFVTVRVTWKRMKETRGQRGRPAPHDPRRPTCRASAETRKQASEARTQASEARPASEARKASEPRRTA